MCRFHTVANWREDERRYAGKQLIPVVATLQITFPYTQRRHVRFWHLADMLFAARNVRVRG